MRHKGHTSGVPDMPNIPKPPIRALGQGRAAQRERRCIPCPCGRINKDGAQFCGACGRSLEAVPAMRMVPIDRLLESLRSVTAAFGRGRVTMAEAATALKAVTLE